MKDGLASDSQVLPKSVLEESYFFCLDLLGLFLACKLPKQISCFSGTDCSCTCWTRCKWPTRCCRNGLCDLQASGFLQHQCFCLLSPRSWAFPGLSPASVVFGLSGPLVSSKCAVFLALSYLKSQHWGRSCYLLTKTSSWMNCAG